MLIFDEDPINSLMHIKSLEISDLVKLEINTGGKNNEGNKHRFTFKITHSRRDPKNSFLSVDLDDLIEQISQKTIATDIFSFLIAPI